MFENPRRGRKARNFTTNVPKILDLKVSSEQIFFRKLTLGAPGPFQPATYGGPPLSRQNQKPHGKNKILHGKTENLTAKTKYLTTKPKLSRQNQRPHGKTKYFTAKTKDLTAKANTDGKTKAILFLL